MRKITKHVTQDQARKVLERFDCVARDLESVKHGEFMFMIRNEKTEVYYVMKRIELIPFSLAYSNTPKTRRGKELIITNCEVPTEARKLLKKL